MKAVMLRRLFVKKCSTVVVVVAFIVVAVTLALIGSIDDRDLTRHQVIGLYTAYLLKDFATLKKDLYWPNWVSRANGTLRAGHC